MHNLEEVYKEEEIDGVLIDYTVKVCATCYRGEEEIARKEIEICERGYKTPDEIQGDKNLKGYIDTMARLGLSNMTRTI